MSEETATIAAPASGGESSAPSSAPISAPAAAPSTPAPTTPSEPTQQNEIGGFIEEAVARSISEAEKTLGKPAEAAPPTVASPAAEAPAAEAPKPGEAVAPPAEANPLDKLGPLPAEKIAAAFKEAPPEVAAFLKEKGLDVETLTQTARDAALATQYQERFPTVEAADTALQGAQNFWKLDEQFPAIKDVATFDKFMMDTLVPLSYILDEEGKPIPDPNIPGAFKNDGSVGRFIKLTTDVEMGKLSEIGSLMLQGAKTEEEKNYAEDIITASKFIEDFRTAGYKMPGSKTDIKSLPADVQARLAEADRIKTDSQTTQAQQQQTAVTQREEKILDQTYDKLTSVFKVLDNSALPDSVKTMVADKVWDKVVEALDKNALYKQQRDSLSPRSPNYQERRVALNEQHMKPLIAKVLAEIIPQVGGPIVDANKERHAKIDTQQQAGRMEPRSGSTTPQSHPGPLTSVDDLHTKALEMARAQNPNAAPGSREYFAAFQKLKGLPISA